MAGRSEDLIVDKSTLLGGRVVECVMEESGSAPSIKECCNICAARKPFFSPKKEQALEIMKPVKSK